MLRRTKPYLLVSLYSTTKILLCGAFSKEQKCPFMVFLRERERGAWETCKFQPTVSVEC